MVPRHVVNGPSHTGLWGSALPHQPLLRLWGFGLIVFTFRVARVLCQEPCVVTCCVPVITEAELPGRSSQLQGSHAGRPKFRTKCAAHSPAQTSSGSMSCCLVSGCVPGSAVRWSWRQTLSPCLGRVCRCRATVTEASDFHVPSAENKQCSSCDPWEQKVLPKPEAGSNRVHWSRPEVWLALVRSDGERHSTTLHGAARECCCSSSSERRFESERLWHET